MLSQTTPDPILLSRSIRLVTPAPIHPDAPMTASELMFYFGQPLAHVVCYQEHWKLERRLAVRRQLGGSVSKVERTGRTKRPALELS